MLMRASLTKLAAPVQTNLGLRAASAACHAPLWRCSPSGAGLRSLLPLSDLQLILPWTQRSRTFNWPVRNLQHRSTATAEQSRATHSGAGGGGNMRAVQADDQLAPSAGTTTLPGLRVWPSRSHGSRGSTSCQGLLPAVPHLRLRSSYLEGLSGAPLAVAAPTAALAASASRLACLRCQAAWKFL